MRREQPDAEMIAALREFAAANGRMWKQELRHAWETGIYPSGCNARALQRVRNGWGPSWLIRFSLITKCAHCRTIIPVGGREVKYGDDVFCCPVCALEATDKP